MKQLPVVLLIVFLQETVTLNGLLVKVHQGSYSPILISLLFIVATLIDIVVGYWLGIMAKRRWNKHGVKTFASRWANRLRGYIGKHGKKIYLFLLGYFSFPYLNAFITAWIGVPFWESFIYLFVGNMLFYITSWLLVLGVMSVVPDPLIAFIVVILLTIAITIAMRLWRSRKI